MKEKETLSLWTQNEFGGSIIDFTVLARFDYLGYEHLLVKAPNGNLYLYGESNKMLVAIRQEFLCEAPKAE